MISGLTSAFLETNLCKFVYRYLTDIGQKQKINRAITGIVSGIM